ncbi:hypothetical protein DPX39_030071700 [Trypanosoma brucei equiperdum]|uniref:Uncharacterized protein n=1 Tax=Trypanosoma brucei equiperdum TaxID=630700 RepID=A0A3L6LC34_9TRYP|nr:hypothetical protein DPX39_030066700 [Trypanosoma brucei equiperdum]RHW73436.1 hypothetical protein DPX39_030061700 [Trypanosoma brucei equiperdum]RHW73626.1 hypothetical protein DPX39_030056700 [Trypanosoma brucei equiperdum]RHW73801.1 hypothetical protein DPX39_030071700 [Trypanosoma brucei equiperdum]
MLRITTAVFLVLARWMLSAVVISKAEVQVVYFNQQPSRQLGPLHQAQGEPQGKAIPNIESQRETGSLAHDKALTEEDKEDGRGKVGRDEKTKPDTSRLKNSNGSVTEKSQEPYNDPSVVSKEQSTIAVAEGPQGTKKQQNEIVTGRGETSGERAARCDNSRVPQPEVSVSVVNQGSTQGVKTVSKRSVDEGGKEISQQQVSGQYESYVALPQRNGMSEREVSRPSEVALDDMGEPSSLRESVPRGNGASRKRYAILLSAGLRVVFS